MKLNDIGNMEEYLLNDCYCPGEIYDVSGFFFQVFNKDEECKKIGERKSVDGKSNIVCVACRNQLINFWIVDEKIIEAERYDATDNNIKFMKAWLAENCTEGMRINEFNEGETKRTLDSIMKYADAIIIN